MDRDFYVVLIVIILAILFIFEKEYITGKQIARQREPFSSQAHITYFDLSNHNLKHAHYIGSGGNCGNREWFCEVIDDSPSGISSGGYPSLVLDSKNVPHIVYGSQGTNSKLTLRYAKLVGSEGSCPLNSRWNCITVNPPDIRISSGSIALDSLGLPQVGYMIATSATSISPRYAKFDGSSWIITAEPPIDHVVLSLDLDSSDTPHVVMRKTDGYFYYLKKTQSGWIEEKIDKISQFATLKLDNDVPHISYTRTSPDGTETWLNYATKSAPGIGNCGRGNWICTTVDSLEGDYSLGHWTSIDVDSYGKPHIAYWDIPNLMLKHAYEIGSGGNCGWGEWNCENVAPAYWGAFPSLAIDEYDNVHISYLGSINRDLYYAYFNRDYWNIHAVDTKDEVGFYTSIDVSKQKNILR